MYNIVPKSFSQLGLSDLFFQLDFKYECGKLSYFYGGGTMNEKDADNRDSQSIVIQR